MALNDFFRINFPYGIKKHEGEFWYAFNREYLPLGFNSFEIDRSELNNKFFNQYPILTKYKSLDEDFLIELAGEDKYIRKDESDIINMILLYDDANNPQSFPQYWDRYNKKVKLLSNLKAKR